MNLTDTQQLILSAVSETEFTATREIAVKLNLSCVCVRDNSRVLVEMGIVAQEEKKFERSPFRIKKGGKVKPSFDKLLFSTNF